MALRQHLFEELGITRDAIGLYRVGRGVVLRESVSPAALSYRADGAATVRKAARQAAAAAGLDWKEANALVLHRGPYVIAAGLDESVPNGKPFALHGQFIDLFDAGLPVLHYVALTPGKRALLFDLGFADSPNPRVLTEACRIRDEHFTGKILQFTAVGDGDTQAVVRIAAKSAPVSVLIGGQPAAPMQYDPASGTLLLRFLNATPGVSVAVSF
jgi:hypothetical protein